VVEVEVVRIAIFPAHLEAQGAVEMLVAALVAAA
jgi:hypothetical protein